MSSDKHNLSKRKKRKEPTSPQELDEDLEVSDEQMCDAADKYNQEPASSVPTNKKPKSKKLESDDDEDDEDDVVVKPPTKKAKLKKGVESSDSENNSNSDEEEGDDATYELPLVKDYKALVAPYVADGTEPLSNPNVQFKKYHETNNTNMHYSTFDPTKHFVIKKTGEKTVYVNINSTLSQRCDFQGKGVLLDSSDFYEKIRNFRVPLWSPFGVVSQAQMFPNGTKDPLFNGAKFGPQSASSIEMRFAFKSDEYTSKLGMEVSGVRLDRDHYNFLTHWLKDGFLSFITCDSIWLSFSDALFPARLKQITKEVDENIQKKFEDELSKYNQLPEKQRRKVPMPSAQDPKRVSRIRESFLMSFQNAVRTKDKHPYVIVSRPLFVTETKKEQDKPNKPVYHPPTELAKQMWENPEPFKKSDGSYQPGYKRMMNPVRMYRVITADERKAGINFKGNMMLVPFENSFIIDDDIVAVQYSIEPYDSPLGAGFRLRMNSVLWLGTKNTLDLQREPLKDVPAESYFLTGQRYNREKGFKVRNVERSGPDAIPDLDAQEWNEFLSY